MKVLIESPFTINEIQEQDIKKNLSDLSKYNNKITQVGVFFKLDDGIMPNAVLAEIQIHVPGPVVFASDTATDFMEAFEGAVNKVERQMRKAKDIRKSYH